MNLHKFGIAMVVVSGVLCSAPAVAGDSDFTLVNKTGITISGVFLAPSSKKSGDWGKDRLGDKVLNQNQSRLFKFSDKASCMQDMSVSFDDKNNSDLVWEDLNLCEINKLTLKYNKAKNEVSYDQE